MPLVLYSGGGPSRDGYDYDDRTGVSYEFPDAYLSRMVEGQRFVYHQPRAYTGIGVVGPLAQSKTVGRSVCEVLDWRPFDRPLGLKDEAGQYYEVDRDAGQVNVYWAQGVRSITDSAFERIVAAADLASFDGLSTTDSQRNVARSPIERYAVDVVLDLLRAENPGATVEELPPNNPGFDIRIGSVRDPERYINVRGTSAADPVFWLTEGERQFSVLNAARYELFVIAAIDLRRNEKSHHVHRHAGAVERDSVTIEPSQWRGSLAG